MIAMSDNRPVLQIGRHQVCCYESDWLLAALERATVAAGLSPFPCLEEISTGIFEYLESACPLKLLPVERLHDRVRRMLEKIGCPAIARHFEPCAPPVSVSLLDAAHRAGPGFELAFFEAIRSEITELRRFGAAAIHITGHREALLHLSGQPRWNRRCEALLEELHAFLEKLCLPAQTTARPQCPVPSA